MGGEGAVMKEISGNGMSVYANDAVLFADMERNIQVVD